MAAAALLVALLTGDELLTPHDLLFLARRQGRDGSWGPLSGGCRCPRSHAPSPSIDPFWFEMLRARLGHPLLEERRRAERALLSFGRGALLPLQEAAAASDPEIAGRCRNLTARLHADGAMADPELTGLGVLALLGAGYAPTSRVVFDDIRLGQVVKQGILRLMAMQREDGGFDSPCPVGNAVAALALCEAYAQNEASPLKEPALRGLRGLERVPPTDVRLAAWTVLALRCGEVSGLHRADPDVLRACERTLADSTRPKAAGARLLLGGPPSRAAAEPLARLDPRDLDAETLFFAALAIRRSGLHKSDGGRAWFDRLRGLHPVTFLAPDPASGIGPMRRILPGPAGLQDVAVRTLAYQVVYRYAASPGETLSSP
jgi:hypothetical protein